MNVLLLILGVLLVAAPFGAVTAFAAKEIYKNGLWWLPDMSMYCYFKPVFWRVR